MGWLTVLLNFSYDLLPNLWDSEHQLAAWLRVKRGVSLCQDSPWRTMTDHSPSFWLRYVCCALPAPAWPEKARTSVALSLCISFYLSRNRILLLTVLQSLLHWRRQNVELVSNAMRTLSCAIFTRFSPLCLRLGRGMELCTLQWGENFGPPEVFLHTQWITSQMHGRWPGFIRSQNKPLHEAPDQENNKCSPSKATSTCIKFHH